MKNSVLKGHVANISIANEAVWLVNCSLLHCFRGANLIGLQNDLIDPSIFRAWDIVAGTCRNSNLSLKF